jgi:hypothetical protein
VGLALQAGRQESDIIREFVVDKNPLGLCDEYAPDVMDSYELEMRDAVLNWQNPVRKPPMEEIVLVARNLGVQQYPIVIPPVEYAWNEPRRWWIRERAPIEIHIDTLQSDYGRDSPTYPFIGIVKETLNRWMTFPKLHVSRMAILQYIGYGSAGFIVTDLMKRLDGNDEHPYCVLDRFTNRLTMLN